MIHIFISLSGQTKRSLRNPNILNLQKTANVRKVAGQVIAHANKINYIVLKDASAMHAKTN